MAFPSISFLFIFLPVSLLLYIVLPQKGKHLWLWLSSLIFYVWAGIGQTLLLLGMEIIVYGFGRYIAASSTDTQRQRRLFEGLIVLIMILFYFKYYGFFLDNVTSLFSLHASYEVFAMPLGISFISFTAMAYLIDVKRGSIPAETNFWKLAVYVSFFPKLVMGPIERYADWQQQLAHSWSSATLEQGAIRFLTGLAQKLLLADTLAPLWAYTSAHEVSLVSAWLGILAYTFEIYFDFQGYMNMAIGLANMFGFTMKENFEHPYMSTSITEFWRRWHMTLGSWFRDYVYIPLGGNRKGKGRTILNLLIVWGLTGFWHGASWNFLLWGLYYGVLLILEKFVFAHIRGKLPVFLQWLISFLLVMLGWVLFALPSLSDITRYLTAMFANRIWWDSKTLALMVNYGSYLLIGAICCSELPLCIARRLKEIFKEQLWLLKPVLTVLVSVILLSYLLSAGYQSFLYVQF